MQFLTSALYGGGQLRAPVAVRLGPQSRSGRGGEKKEIPPTPAGNRIPVVQPVACYYTDTPVRKNNGWGLRKKSCEYMDLRTRK